MDVITYPRKEFVGEQCDQWLYNTRQMEMTWDVR